MSTRTISLKTPSRNSFFVDLVGLGIPFNNRPYSRWLFPTYAELYRCRIQAGHLELVSLIHLLPRDLVPCAICIQTITGHLTGNSTISINNILGQPCVIEVCNFICNPGVRTSFFRLPEKKRN